MKLKVFSIKDKALDAYSAPFTQATVEAGIRMWRDLVMFQDESNRYKRNPEDYILYMIGEFDDTDGKMEAEKPTRLSSATEVLAELNKPEDS